MNNYEFIIDTTVKAWFNNYLKWLTEKPHTIGDDFRYYQLDDKFPISQRVFDTFIANNYLFDDEIYKNEMRWFYKHLSQIFKDKSIYVFKKAIEEVTNRYNINAYDLMEIVDNIKDEPPKRKNKAKLTIKNFIKGY